MKRIGVLVEVQGGCVQQVHGVKSYTILDWDAILEGGDTLEQWNSLSDELRYWISVNRQEEYNKVLALMSEELDHLRKVGRVHEGPHPATNGI